MAIFAIIKHIIINFDNMENYEILQIEFMGNSLYAWILAAAVFFVALIVMKVFKTIILVKLKKLTKKTETDIDDIVINAIQAVHWPFFALIALYIALRFISVPEAINNCAYYIILINIVYYAVRALQKFVDYGAQKISARRGDEAENEGIMTMITILIKIGLWALAVLLILANLGYNITSLIAGLGIGGLAVALAVQNILSDLFSSVSIYLDKPFKPGDFIILDNGAYMGTVKRIGIKTTRVQTLQGEELVVSNHELTATKIQNFGKMQRRRIVFAVGVTYNTPAEKLEKIPEIIREIVEAQDKATLDRSHFKEFADSSLNFETVYFVELADYNEYMNTQQKINLALVKKFEEEKIEFAFPTQTVYLEKQ